MTSHELRLGLELELRIAMKVKIRYMRVVCIFVGDSTFFAQQVADNEASLAAKITKEVSIIREKLVTVHMNTMCITNQIHS